MRRSLEPETDGERALRRAREIKRDELHRARADAIRKQKEAERQPLIHIVQPELPIFQKCERCGKCWAPRWLGPRIDEMHTTETCGERVYDDEERVSYAFYDGRV